MASRFDAIRGNGKRQPAVPIDAAFTMDYVHRLRFTSDVLDPANPVLREVLAKTEDSPGRPVVVVDQGVAEAWPGLCERIDDYVIDALDWMTLAAPVQIVPGGETCKNDWSVYESVARTIHDAAICRHSYVLVIGGGAVLDAAGFAAATAHRGVRLVRLPTTTLAQADAGIGVKNGINAFGKKNFLGCFAVPWAVINDEKFLTTLTDRDWRCGLSEAVKVALLKDASFFDIIESAAPRLKERDQTAMRSIVRRSAELHLQHIVSCGDPFEMRGARPLDFGHWSAHKLEQMTDFSVKHGEAVAIGLAIDVLYSATMGRLPGSEAERIVRLLEALGFSLYHAALNDPALFEGLEEFREHLGGQLTITLLDAIGRPFDVHEIDLARMSDAIAHLATVAARPLS